MRFRPKRIAYAERAADILAQERESSFVPIWNDHILKTPQSISGFESSINPPAELNWEEENGNGCSVAESFDCNCSQVRTFLCLGN